MGWINLKDGDRIYLSQDGRLSNQFLADAVEIGYVASEGGGLVLYVAGNRYAIRNSRFPITINPVQPGIHAAHQAFHQEVTHQAAGISQLTSLAHHAQTFVLSEEVSAEPAEEPKETPKPEKKKTKEKKNSRFAGLDD